MSLPTASVKSNGVVQEHGPGSGT